MPSATVPDTLRVWQRSNWPAVVVKRIPVELSTRVPVEEADHTPPVDSGKS
jgi:hypothetical protein